MEKPTEEFIKGYEQGQSDLLDKQEIINIIKKSFLEKFCSFSEHENYWQVSELDGEKISEWIGKTLDELPEKLFFKKLDKETKNGKDENNKEKNVCSNETKK